MSGSYYIQKGTAMITRNHLILALIVCIFAGSAVGKPAEDRTSLAGNVAGDLAKKISDARRELMFLSLSASQQEALTTIAQADPVEFDELFSDNPGAAAGALKSLVTKNKKSAEVLIYWGLKHPHWKVRLASLESAGPLKKPSNALINPLRRQLKHYDPYGPHYIRGPEDVYSQIRSSLAAEIARVESKAALMALVSWGDEEVLPFLLNKLIGRGRETGWIEGPYELVTLVLKLNDRRAIPTLMNCVDKKASLWETQQSGGPRITVTAGDMAIFLILRQTRQGINGYFFYVPERVEFWDLFEDEEEYCPGFADQEARQKAIQKVRQWWNDHQKEYEGVETLKLNIPQPGKKQPWEEHYREPEGFIEGHVYDSAGKAAFGALVTIHPWGQTHVRTDSQGEFRIERSVADWGHKPMRLVALDRAKKLAAVVEITKETRTMDLTLLPTVDLSGLAVDPMDKPISDARVTISIAGKTYIAELALIHSKSNKEGQFILLAVPRGQKYWVETSHYSYGNGERRIAVPQKAEGSISLDPIVMAIADASISGVVVDGNGKPIVSATVSSHGTGQPWRDATTDGQGRFTLERVCKGTIKVMAFDPDTGSAIAEIEAVAPSENVKLVKRAEKVQ